MKPFKHTKGPWRTIDRGRGPHGCQLARFWIGSGDPATDQVCEVSCHQHGPIPQPNDDEAEGNAILLSESPTLLKALRALWVECGREEVSPATQQLVTATLHKLESLE